MYSTSRRIMSAMFWSDTLARHTTHREDVLCRSATGPGDGVDC